MIFIIYLLNLLYADILGKFRVSDTSKIDRVQMKVKKLISGSKLGRNQLVFLELWRCSRLNEYVISRKYC